MYPKGQAVSPAEQRRILEEALGRADRAGASGVAVFDLDSTLLDNRSRQARILAEYGAGHGLAALAGARPEHWSGWDLADAMRATGLDAQLVAIHAAPAKAFWRERFFTSAYCATDRAIAGASTFVSEVSARGAQVAYVTGRHLEMGPGSVVSLRNGGFPLPDGERVHLLLKPSFETSDDAWKEEAYARLEHLGRVALAFDNEPTHINGYAARFTGALCVHLATDDSGRPVPLAAGIPSIADFTR